jgi:hypothetical protein
LRRNCSNPDRELPEGKSSCFIASIQDLAIFRRRWNWWPPFIISVIKRRIMVAKTALLVEPFAVSALEKTESFSIAVD